MRIHSCLNRTRWIFRILLFVLFVTLVSAVIGYFRMENSDRNSYFYFGHIHGAHHLAGALMLGRGLTNDEFVPGTYLTGRTLGSTSCKYTFWDNPDDNDDPWAMLNWSQADVKPSLELGETSPYKVVYNIVKSSNLSNDNIITYCTHATPEFLYHISELLKHWDGYISITVYAPGEDAYLAVMIIHRLCRCIPDMHRVSLHLTFPYDVPPKKLEYSNIKLPEDCSPPRNLPDTLRHSTGMTYPVNVARNSAREAATTQFVLVSDIELQPSAGLSTQFSNLMKRLLDRQYSLQKVNPSQVWTGLGFVYVLPVFEIETGAKIPSTKEDLLALYTRDKAVFFHRWVCPHCQKFPGLQKWLRRKGTPGFLQPLLVVRREYPFHRWEPVYIGTKNEPFYSEELSWEGQQDKMTQMDAMCLHGYKFVILDRGFLVHSPGMKRRANVLANSVWRKPHEQRNIQLYRGITKRMLAKVKKTNIKCKVL